MTGNDIVDITVASAESNWRRKGFADKIFTVREQEYVNQSEKPDEIVWRLWSMKESAYKAYTRQYGGRFFAPQKFSCVVLNQTDGEVAYNKFIYQTATLFAKEFIYSTARPAAIKNIDFISSFFYLPQTTYVSQQQFIYQKIIERYHATTGEAVKNLAVLKNKNEIPFLYCGNNLQVPVSITHHGKFAAFTIY